MGQMLAFEGLRSCLRDTSLPYGELLGNTPLSLDTLEESMDDNGRWMHIKFKMRIWGVSSVVVASCSIQSTEDSGVGWNRGTCDIEFPEGYAGLIWNYAYTLRHGQLTTYGLFSESALRS